MIKINGQPSEYYGVTFLQGTLEELLKLPPLKDPITNSTRKEHGVQMEARNSKLDSRKVTLNFKLYGISEEDYLDNYQALLTLFMGGKDGTGIIELSYSRFIFRLRFDSCDTLRILAPNIGNFSASFTEPNPYNRG